MEEVFIYLFIGVLIGGLIGWLITHFKAKSEVAGVTSVNELLTKSEAMLKTELTNERQRNEKLQAELAAGEQNLSNLAEKLATQQEETKKIQERFTKEFENLANKILEEKSAKFTEQNKESIQNILHPLKEKIVDFERKVDTSHKESIDRHAALRQQIIGLQQLNQQISQEALNLTKALKGDSKMQGNWGELVLERILEKSGLEKGREYEVQQSFTTDENKRVLPDVVIHLPGDKKMIIDSKVSLRSYEQLINAEDEHEKERLTKLHLAAINKHIVDLSDKNYHDLYQIESPDFVLLFIPIEPAFALALNTDSQLYSKAFEKNIVIVTPTTLLATLRTIDTMWNNDKQQRNALKIATEAGKLYDQFVNLLDDFEKIGNQINTVQRSYDTSMKKFTGRGNMLNKVAKLKQLGAKANKVIPQKWMDRSDEEE